MLINGSDIRIIHATTGEIIRELISTQPSITNPAVSASPGNTRHRGSKCFLCLATSHWCARGDLNLARPTLVMPKLASLSVK